MLWTSTCASPVPSALFQEMVFPYGSVDDLKERYTRRAPSGVHTGNSSFMRLRRDAGQRASRPVVHPDVSLAPVSNVHGDSPAVGREFGVVPLGRLCAKRGKRPGPVHPHDRACAECVPAGNVGHRARLRQGQLRTAPAVIRLDAINRTRRRTGHRQSPEVEGHRKQRVVLHVHDVAAARIASEVAAALDDRALAGRQGLDDQRRPRPDDHLRAGGIEDTGASRQYLREAMRDLTLS